MSLISSGTSVCTILFAVNNGLKSTGLFLLYLYSYLGEVICFIYLLLPQAVSVYPLLCVSFCLISMNVFILGYALKKLSTIS